jgi:hypothetical protein
MRVNPRNGFQKIKWESLEGRKVEHLNNAIAATLIAHSGAVMCSREELKGVKTPRATETWKPVPHSKLIDCVEETLQRNHFKIAKEEYAIQSEGNKLFGVLTLNSELGGYALALGIRTSNDKSFPVQMIAGARVFVCDNLAFSGNVVTLRRKHTSGLDIRQEVVGGVSRALVQFQSLSASVDRMKAIDLAGKDNFAKAKIVDAAVKGVMPLRLIPAIYQNYFEPKHDEFKARNAWSLHNAFTEAFKELKPNIAMSSGVELGKLFAV